MWEFIQCTTRENKLLQKDLLGLQIHKFYKYMTAVIKKLYIDKLDKKVDKNKNTYHRTIKIKPAIVTSNT